MQTQTETTKRSTIKASQAQLAIKLAKVERKVSNGTSRSVRDVERKESAQTYDFVGIAG